MPFSHGDTPFDIDHILVMYDAVKYALSYRTFFIFRTVAVDPEIPIIGIVLCA